MALGSPSEYAVISLTFALCVLFLRNLGPLRLVASAGCTTSAIGYILAACGYFQFFIPLGIIGGVTCLVCMCAPLVRSGVYERSNYSARIALIAPITVATVFIATPGMIYYGSRDLAEATVSQYATYMENGNWAGAASLCASESIAYTNKRIFEGIVRRNGQLPIISVELPNDDCPPVSPRRFRLTFFSARKPVPLHNLLSGTVLMDSLDWTKWQVSSIKVD